MMMPGRKFSTQNGYRYGFNGKENDDEVKGDGNQQDYGLRIYDVRIGKFLSVDPLIAKYPFYSPYQFSGNDVIRCIDLDGGEPTSKVGEWDRNTSFLSGTTYNFVYDKVNHRMFDVQAVVEPTTGQLWIVAEDGQGQHEYFYLVNDDGSTDRLRTYVENGRTVLYKSHFKKFETRDQLNVRQAGEIANFIGICFFGIAASSTIIVAAEGALTTYGTKTIGDFIVEEIKDEIKDQVLDIVEESTGIPLAGVPDKKDLKKAGRSTASKQRRIKAMLDDDKESSVNRGWVKNEARRIKSGNGSKNYRMPFNGRKSPGKKAKDKGLELAHPHDAPASKGGSYDRAKVKNHSEHKVETRLHRKRY